MVMSDAQAIRALRLQLVRRLGTARDESDYWECRQIVFDIAHVCEYGNDWLIELRLRRYDRRASLPE